EPADPAGLPPPPHGPAPPRPAGGAGAAIPTVVLGATAARRGRPRRRTGLAAGMRWVRVSSSSVVPMTAAAKLSSRCGCMTYVLPGESDICHARSRTGHPVSAAGKKVGDVVDSSRRMLELLSLLQLRREWPGAELAERLGVSDRTLRRDIDKLRELDYPVHAGRGAGGGYRLGDGGRLPPLQFLSDEAVAAAIALTTAASSNVHGVGEA